jgi:hypothetical protein
MGEPLPGAAGPVLPVLTPQDCSAITAEYDRRSRQAADSQPFIDAYRARVSLADEVAELEARKGALQRLCAEAAPVDARAAGLIACLGLFPGDQVYECVALARGDPRGAARALLGKRS